MRACRAYSEARESEIDAKNRCGVVGGGGTATGEEGAAYRAEIRSRGIKEVDTTYKQGENPRECWRRGAGHRA